MPISDQGLNDDRYLLIPRTLIFLTSGDEILLIQGAPHKRIWANLYNGIGGHIERGEDPLSAARREMAEETGLHVPDLRFCGTITIDLGNQPGIVIFVFKGETTAKAFSASPEGDLAWVPINQVFDLPLVEDLPILLPKVLATSSDSAPFSGQYHYDSNGQLQMTFAK